MAGVLGMAVGITTMAQEPASTNTVASSDKQVVSFGGIVTRMVQNRKLVEASVGNADDNMITAYGIVLDTKGKALAEVKGPVHVTGRIKMVNGKNMIVVDNFTKGWGQKTMPQSVLPEAKHKAEPPSVKQTDSPRTIRPKAITAPQKPASSNDWMDEKHLAGVDLTGKWQLTLPAGFISTAAVSRVSVNQYRLQKTGNLSGTYELRGNELIVVMPSDARLTESTWKFKSADSLVLVKSPSGAGSDYTGATLKRINE